MTARTASAARASAASEISRGMGIADRLVLARRAGRSPGRCRRSPASAGRCRTPAPRTARYSRNSSPSSAPSRPRGEVSARVSDGRDRRGREATWSERLMVGSALHGVSQDRRARRNCEEPAQVASRTAQRPRAAQGSLSKPSPKPFRLIGNADAFFRRLEDDEGRGLAGAQLLDQVVVHDHLGDAAVRQAAHETGAADVGLVDLEPEARTAAARPSGASTRISRLFWSAVFSTMTVRPTLGRSSAITLWISAHCSPCAPGGVSQRICQSPCTDLTAPCAARRAGGAERLPQAHCGGRRAGDRQCAEQRSVAAMSP